MKVLSSDQMRACDKFTIENEPIDSVDLMERASRKLFEWIALHYSKNEQFVLFVGPGNNGGDALALARLLRNGGYNQVKVFLLKISSILSDDCKVNYDRLIAQGKVIVEEIEKEDEFPLLEKSEIIIDGIFGSGLSRSIEGYWASLIDYLNSNSSEIIAIDAPSGLFVDADKRIEGAVIEADITLSFQVPKKAFFFAENNKYVGSWHIVDIGLHKEFVSKEITNLYYIQHESVLKKLKKRNVFAHKGDFGHALLIAGSYQKTGAAILSAKACLRSGVGLLTVHVPESGYEIMQTAVPEAMLCIDETEMNYCSKNVLDNYSAIGIGPGIGKKPSMKNALHRILEINKQAMIFDADAINLLAENSELFDLIEKDSILTPHPGEFDRLTKKHSSGLERLHTQIELSKKKGIYIVLKGAFTSISTPDGLVYFNSTGNSGMATAGSGDVLTGIILSLLAQGYSCEDAAIVGVYIHGLAGDIAENEVGQEALIASDIIKNLGNAFIQIRAVY